MADGAARQLGTSRAITTHAMMSWQCFLINPEPSYGASAEGNTWGRTGSRASRVETTGPLEMMLFSDVQLARTMSINPCPDAALESPRYVTMRTLSPAREIIWVWQHITNSAAESLPQAIKVWNPKNGSLTWDQANGKKAAGGIELQSARCSSGNGNAAGGFDYVFDNNNSTRHVGKQDSCFFSPRFWVHPRYAKAQKGTCAGNLKER